MSQLFEFHGLFESWGFLPEETLPGGEVGSFEESMFEDTLDTSESLDHISSIVIEIPQFSIMFLMGPPEGILFE